ncbi:MAG: hypothetical protein ICV54_24015 [Nostoc sp. C3-bin3]|nr:hypothetical protein [Nostoc sp. C3-bin3]
MSTTGYAYAIGGCSAIAFKLFYLFIKLGVFGVRSRIKLVASNKSC